MSNKNIKLQLTAKAQLIVDYNLITNKAVPIETNISLELSPGLDESKYLNDETVFTQEGCRIATTAFCQALIGNIHVGHEHGFRDSAEHLRYIIDTITEGFAKIPAISIGHTSVDNPFEMASDTNE